MEALGALSELTGQLESAIRSRLEAQIYQDRLSEGAAILVGFVVLLLSLFLKRALALEQFRQMIESACDYAIIRLDPQGIILIGIEVPNR